MVYYMTADLKHGDVIRHGVYSNHVRIGEAVHTVGDGPGQLPLGLVPEHDWVKIGTACPNCGMVIT